MGKTINQLAEQTTLNAGDLFLLQRGNGHYKVKIENLFSGGFVEDTVANVQSARSSSLLSKGSWYYLTDAYVWIMAIDVDKVSSNGYFLARNGDYQSVGDYSQVTIANGFTVTATGTNLGVWTAALAPVAGDIVIYNNLHWLNLTGAVGTAPSGDAVNWEPVSNLVNGGPNLDETLAEIQNFGYVFEIDEVRYDLTDNKVVSRIDRRGNIVTFDTENSLQNPIEVFQWGNDNVYGNKVEANSLITCHNNRQNIQYNTFRNCTLTLAMATNNFTNNVLTNVDSVDYSTEAANIQNQVITDSAFTTIAAFGANQDDFDLPEGTNYHMSSSGAPRTVNGIAGGREGRRILIRNKGALNLVFAHEAGTSAAANRINTDNIGGASLTLTDSQTAEFIYSTDNSRWNLITLFW